MKIKKEKPNLLFFIVLFSLFLFTPKLSKAATLNVVPETGVYASGNAFSVQIKVNTQGKSIIAAEGLLNFNPQELSVVSIDKAGSIFNMWAVEPDFSNTAGTIKFAGGKVGGFSENSGTVINVTFRTKTNGVARLTFSEGLITENGPTGTNILSGMNGGTFTVQAPSSSPTPETVQYVAPANTPAAPVVNSSSHPDGVWSDKKTANLTWTLPAGVTAVRTNLDRNPNTIPTKLYESPIREITLNDLEEGVSYFHIQFKNAEGWGKVTHYKLATDTEKPESLKVDLKEGADLSNSIQTLVLEAEDKTSEIQKYLVKIDDGEPIVFSVKEEEKSEMTLPALLPGVHNLVIEVYDLAGNNISTTLSFTILAFAKPVFTEYPKEINEEVIPVIRGKTKANAKVEIIFRKSGQEPNSYETTADETGVFTFIPEGTLSIGVYELSARATDEFSSKSEISDTIKIAVQQPGYLRVGSLLLSTLSVFVPLIAVILLLVLLSWYLLVYLSKFKKRLVKESDEVIEIVERKFDELEMSLLEYREQLKNSKRTKELTLAENEILTHLASDLKNARKKITKEVKDVEEVIKEK